VKKPYPQERLVGKVFNGFIQEANRRILESLRGKGKGRVGSGCSTGKGKITRKGHLDQMRTKMVHSASCQSSTPWGRIPAEKKENSKGRLNPGRKKNSNYKRKGRGTGQVEGE